MSSVAAPFQSPAYGRSEPGVGDRVRRQQSRRRSYATATFDTVRNRAFTQDNYYRQQAGEQPRAFRHPSPVKSTAPRRVADVSHHNEMHPMFDYPADIRPEIRPNITVTDAQIRAAFGPSPIFGSTLTGNPLSPEALIFIPALPPSPIFVPPSEDDDDELESMKSLTLNEMVAVMHGAPVPKSKTPSPDVTWAPRSCPPTPIPGFGFHPPLPGEVMRFRLPPSASDAPIPPGFDSGTSSTC